MSELYIIKVGELSLKGNNRHIFEKKLKNNIRMRLSGFNPSLSGRKGRFYLKIDESASQAAEKVLESTFGVTAFAKAVTSEKDIEIIRNDVLSLLETYSLNWNTFKVESRRSDKSFSSNSYQISSYLGASILEKYPDKKAKMSGPDLTVNIEIREKVYIYTSQGRGPGGLPVGTAGRGLLMLSGGIDSPVAGYLMAKRGLKIDAVYFHTAPYTSDEAKEKVIKLAEKLSFYTNGIRLFIVPFTDIQMAVNRGCTKDEITIHTRSAMVEITHRLALQTGANCIISGEALSQVASQTPESIRVTGSYTDFPVLRPLIGYDKEEIIRIAERIGTFKTSILPYDDCCSLFAPDHPLTRPLFAKLRENHKKLELEAFFEPALKGIEAVIFNSMGIRK